MISVVVITYNEEDHLGHCLNSIPEFIEDIVIVDAYSQDQTIDIASANGARFFQKKWTGYGHARNFGADKAQHSWILSLDADEVLSEDFSENLQSIALEASSVYSFKRINVYNGRKIRYGFYQPEWKSRLYHRDFVSWNLDFVHEQLKLSRGHVNKKCSGIINHYSFESIEELNTKLGRYAKLSARQWKERGISPNWIKRKVGPAYHFLKTYIVQKGFLEGSLGYDLAKVAARYNRAKLDYYRT